jgi:hypothetical protein
LSVEFSTGGYDKKTRARKAEESPFLEEVAREELVKSQQPGKGIAGTAVICEMWKSAIAL